MSLRFRKQVLSARAAPHLGPIRTGHNPRFTSVAAASFVICAALIAFAAWTSVTRKTRLPGILVPTLGTLDLTASHTGTLLEVLVKEGDEVDAGQTLLRIGTDRRSKNGDTSALVMDSLSQRRAALHAERLSAIGQAQHRNASLGERLRNMHIEHQQAHDELKALQSRLALARRNVERFEQLSGDGFVSAVVVQQKHEELLDLGLRERAAQRGLTTLTRDAQAVRAEQTASSAALRVQLAQLDRQQSALYQESIEVDARSEVALLAPRRGAISSLSLHAGQSVQAGHTLITLVPWTSLGTPSPLEAHLYAPSRTVGFLQPGQSVWLRYAAYPYQKFGMAQARIVSVSRTPINPQDLPAGHAQPMLQAARSHEPLYRITASLASQTIRTYGTDHALRPGMALDAHVIQDRRAVWEWLLDPLLATASRHSAPSR